MGIWSEARDAAKRETDWQRKHRELQAGYEQFTDADEAYEAHNDIVADHQDNAPRLWRKHRKQVPGGS